MIRKLSNPPSPFQSQYYSYVGDLPEVSLEVYEERARSILSENDSPDLPFRWSLNPYRGCQHACAYCYARPYHEFLDLCAGSDFDTKLFVKVNAADLLRDALSRPTWRGEVIHFSGVTDCYQPLEAVWRLTRSCLAVCLEFKNPVAIVTKGYLIVRDAPLLAELHRVSEARVLMSIPFADDEVAGLIEPSAPKPSRRFEAMQAIHQTGVPVGVLVAPVIPGLNDRDIPTILQRASECGASSAGQMALRLPGSVESVFFERLSEAVPLRAKRIRRRLLEIRGGRTNDARFGRRMSGQGPYWDSIRRLFEVSCQRYGLSSVRGPSRQTELVRTERPQSSAQQLLPFE